MAGTFDKTYTGVTWTEGDIATEEKMDNMVNNDQAHDAYASQGITLNNTVQLVGKDSGGDAQDMIKVDASDNLVIGDADLDEIVNPQSMGFMALACSLYRTATLSIPHATFTEIIFDNAGYEEYDPSSLHSTGTNTDRIVASVAGNYMVYGYVRMDDANTQARVLIIRKNATTVVTDARAGGDEAGRWAQGAMGFVALGAGDYVNMTMYQTSGGGALNAIAMRLMLFKIG